MNVLGIETSCDETAAAVVGAAGVLSDVVYTQTVHADYGGVVPEWAARDHAERLLPLVEEALSRAGLSRPDAVAATTGPGLVGALLVGVAAAKSLAWGWGVPFVGVHHLEGHALACLLEDPAPRFPFLSLVVSGGHTALYVCRGLGEHQLFGQTLDDAAGEAFDKVARLLDLGFPGGPAVDRLAVRGDPTQVTLPRPLPGRRDWSFAGLKTAVRTRWTSEPPPLPEDLCAAFQAAVVDLLLDRVRQAMAATGLTRVVLSGGVAANSELRRRATAELEGATVFLPPRSRCTDNGAMIANVGRLKLLAGQRDDLRVAARPSWALA